MQYTPELHAAFICNTLALVVFSQSQNIFLFLSLFIVREFRMFVLLRRHYSLPGSRLAKAESDVTSTATPCNPLNTERN